MGSKNILRMKLNVLLFQFCLANYKDSTGILFHKMHSAVDKCMFYMEKALVCSPPVRKIGEETLESNILSRLWYLKGKTVKKYTHRLSQVFLDAIHHFSRGKCPTIRIDNGKDESLNLQFFKAEALYRNTLAELNQMGMRKSAVSQITPNLIDKLEMVCHSETMKILNSNELRNCGKSGAWKRRAKHLLGDLVIMKNVCKKGLGEATIYPK